MNNNPGGASSERTSRPMQENTGDVGSIPGLGRSPGGGQGNLLHFSCLENPMDRGVRVGDGVPTVQRVAQSWARLKRLSTAVIMKTEGKMLHATPRMNLTHSRTKLEAAEHALSDPIHLQVNEG